MERVLIVKETPRRAGKRQGAGRIAADVQNSPSYAGTARAGAFRDSR